LFAAGVRSEPAESVVSLRSPGALMVRIPSGSFVMGSTPDQVLDALAACAREPLGHRCNEQTFENELGQRVVRLPAFFIDRTEVTVDAYARCVAVGQCEAAGYQSGATRFERAGLPVTFVNHDDATAYCRFRAARLPTEAEFERAARGVSGRAYPWGALYNDHVSNHGRLSLFANDPDDGYAELAPVGSFPAGKTPEGVLDLAGNAAEWVADVYRERYGDARVPAAGDERVVRGGSFESAAPFLRGAARRGVSRGSVSPTIGFRCARSESGGPSPRWDRE
jgi:formylglycine-generating enzyme required for sulfatase activity